MGLTGASWVCLVMGVTVYARTVCRGIRTVCRCGNDDGSGMALISSGVRVGAAAFVVGLSLAGPQALGVAAADSSDASSVSSDARNTGAGRAGSVERSAAARSVRRAGLGGAARASAAASVAESAGRTDGRSAPGLVQGRRVNTRSVATPGVVTGGVTSAAVNVSSDAGVGGRLFGGPVANAATSAAPAAATAASTRRPVTRRPTAAPPSDLNPVATANAEINTAFDTLANLLSGLPQGPAADFLGGALLLVRRSLFNQAPTANPVQYGQTETDIVGTLGAVDVEGDPITYTVSQAPEHGAVSIAADGFYTYTPDAFSATDSTDTFTVSVSDSATRLLGPVSFNVVVPVSIRAAEAPTPQAGENVLFVFNWSQYSVKLLGIGGDWEDLTVRPPDGEVVLPGHSFRYALDFGSTVRPDYLTSNGVYLRTEFSSLAVPPYNTSRRVDATGGDQSSIVIYDDDGKIAKQFILDPPNTNAVLTGDVKSQSDLIKWMGGGGPGNCSYNVKEGGVQRNIPTDAQIGNVVTVEADSQGSKNYTFSFTRSATESSTKGYEINAGVKAKLGDKAGAFLGGKWAQSWTKSTSDSYSYSESLTQTLLPHSWNVMISTPSVDSVTGDAVVKLWNTTWTFTDIKYTVPSNSDCKDPQCKEYQGNVRFLSEPMPGGFKLQDVNNRLPNSPEYVLGDQNNYGLYLSAYNGSNKLFAVDFTTKKKPDGQPAIQWTSGDPNVATVDATGKLTVKAPGSTTIKATYVWKFRGDGETVSTELPITVTAPKPVPAV